MKDLVGDAANHTEEIPMKSHYFLTCKEGATSYLKKKLTHTVFGGNLMMSRVYNRHGREQEKVVQVTCDSEV